MTKYNWPKLDEAKGWRHLNLACDPPDEPFWRTRPMNSVRLTTIIVNRLRRA